jgi:uncharacterized protein (DUF849 family)
MDAAFFDKTFINCCPTGMIPTKAMNQNVPITINEIIRESIQLAGLGASILHLHARDENGEPTWKKEPYQRIISGIREHAPDVIICVTTSGRSWSDFARRSEVLELTGDDKPDMASLTLGSMNFKDSTFCNSPQMIIDLCRKMLDTGIKPELEIFSPDMLNQMNILIKHDLLKPPYYANLIFGNIFTMQFDLAQISYCLQHMPAHCITALAGIGRYQLPANQLAMIMNKGVRVGLEDNLYMDKDKKIPASNISLVERIKRFSAFNEQPIASALDLRAALYSNIDSA